VRDLSLMTHEVNLEAPIAVKVFKAIALMVMHKLCLAEDDCGPDLSGRCSLIELASDMLLNCHQAQLKDELD